MESAFTGGAYVLRRGSGGWGFEAKLTANDATAGNEFGISVAVEGETIAIGSQSGVYLFDHETGMWKQKQKLSAVEAGEAFGVSIALKGNTLAVASPATDTRSGSQDNAYTYVFDGTIWSLESTFTYPPTANDMAVALSSKRLLVSQTQSNTVNVYVRTRSGWSPEADFVTSGRLLFGCAVAIGESFVAATECNSSPDAVRVFENLDEIFPNSFE